MYACTGPTCQSFRLLMPTFAGLGGCWTAPQQRHWQARDWRRRWVACCWVLHGSHAWRLEALLMGWRLTTTACRLRMHLRVQQKQRQGLVHAVTLRRRTLWRAETWTVTTPETTTTLARRQQASTRHQPVSSRRRRVYPVLQTVMPCRHAVTKVTGAEVTHLLSQERELFEEARDCTCLHGRPQKVLVEPEGEWVLRHAWRPPARCTESVRFLCAT